MMKVAKFGNAIFNLFTTTSKKEVKLY